MMPLSWNISWIDASTKLFISAKMFSHDYLREKKYSTSFNIQSLKPSYLILPYSAQLSQAQTK